MSNMSPKQYILLSSKIKLRHIRGTINKKVKVHAYSLISSLKIHHPSLRFTPWSLECFICVPFQLQIEHTVLQSFRRIEFVVNIAISVLPGTHFHLSLVKHLTVECIDQGHNIETMCHF